MEVKNLYEEILESATISLLGLKRFIEWKCMDISTQVNSHSLIEERDIDFNKESITGYSFKDTDDLIHINVYFGMINKDTYAYYNYRDGEFKVGLEVNIHNNKYEIITEERENIRFG